MYIKILFNSDAVSKDLSVGWGFSCLVNDNILFDTGEKAEMLAHNLDALKIDFSRISDVVISHDHWDHTGGLEAVLKGKAKLNVYGCPGFSSGLKDKVRSLGARFIENSDVQKIANGVFVTGEIMGAYKGQPMAEQALVLDVPQGLVVITGCAHPGIVEIITRVGRKFPDKALYAVLGGFHLMHMSQGGIDAIVQTFLALGVQKVGPTHCTGTEAINAFKKIYNNNFYPLRVGETWEVS